MISPQEAGTPDDGTSYSWSPFGPRAYWRKAIGAEIAADILSNCDEKLPCAACLVASRIARGETK